MEYATSVIKSCVLGVNVGYVSAHSVSDMFYILRRDLNVEERRETIKFICSYFSVVCENKEDFLSAIEADYSKDMEDSLQMHCANKLQLDYIVTRNVKDFGLSPVRAISAEDFLLSNR
ncbi:type II toxin-antitoxin system VapC family toxin [Fibrobacter sp.]|uniref:type II toxin-antitoxin system VapC family toxin n=1 Tax=Fibrobacter sp. TaxID=35828 RepID=UPI00388D19D8